MKVLSLFDGASCALVCLQRAGIPIDVYYASDIKKNALKCGRAAAEYYGANRIDLGDATKINYSEIESVDLLCAGFPCQDYSMANSARKGINGKNGQLFWEVVRAIRELNPKYIILENVQTIPTETYKMICRESGCFENRKINPRDMGFACERKRLFFTNFLDFLWEVPRLPEKENMFDLLDSDAVGIERKRIGVEPYEIDYIPCQMRQQARLDKIGTTNSGSGTLIEVFNVARKGFRESKKVDYIPTMITEQTITKGGVIRKSGCGILQDKKFRNPTREELARFHHYPVEILQACDFTDAQAQDLMGDGWHCGSCQPIFDELANKIKEGSNAD